MPTITVKVIKDEWVPVYVPVDPDVYPAADEIEVAQELWVRYVASLNDFKNVRGELAAALGG